MATHIKKILEEFLKEERQKSQEWERLKQIIDENLDEGIKKHIRPDKVYRNILFFFSDSSIVSYEFNLKKNKLLAAVRETFPDINDIKMKVR